MTIKVTNNLSFKRDHHGYVLTETFETTKRDGSVGQGSKDYFYPNLDGICGKILHLACDDSKVEQDLEDLRNAYYTALAEMKMLLEGKV
jgi:hypothetical protein